MKQQIENYFIGISEEYLKAHEDLVKKERIKTNAMIRYLAGKLREEFLG